LFLISLFILSLYFSSLSLYLLISFYLVNKKNCFFYFSLSLFLVFCWFSISLPLFPVSLFLYFQYLSFFIPYFCV
jgi:hypothetical protein